MNACELYVRVCAGVLFLGNIAGWHAGIPNLAFLVEVRRISGLVGLAGRHVRFGAPDNESWTLRCQ